MSYRNRFAALLGVLAVIAAIYYFATANRSSDLVLIGTVDSNQVIVSAKIPGRIERLAVDEGSVVKQGDVIAELDRAELQAQANAAAAQLMSMGSQVSSSASTAAQAQGETSSDVASARAQLAEAQANLELERLDNVRMVKLAEEGVASQQDRDRSQRPDGSTTTRRATLRLVSGLRTYTVKLPSPSTKPTTYSGLRFFIE